MKVTVLAKNIVLTNALKETVEKKISKLEKYFNPDVEARATLSVQKNRHTIEVSIPINGIMLRGEETTDDMYKSIDLVEEKLERQIRKQKTRLQRRYSGESLRYLSLDDIDDEDDEENKIVKVKKFSVKPMTTEEAILEMELLGHNFFVFQDADTNTASVIYKRKDGNYGLIEPDYL
ncbi:ribosome hibernation-promoting factor, HPF/YfiA family [Clostridium fallax]|uniref:Ribosome hibernation promoting factor n=1 Tax=Clostridium fallax TaxID=1533 RepID=A0A1M4VDS0_9CLOT|nr:ribosome-associated translation inhibitor RaiA [Clostridium fallax]SHE67106.1 putative sigma-54 modulation protein [Clostridium fallax]SQB05764.1 sigma 54 modulation protein/30S ribosomal protein S30EA [Clostridium fallax]